MLNVLFLIHLASEATLMLYFPLKKIQIFITVYLKINCKKKGTFMKKFVILTMLCFFMISLILTGCKGPVNDNKNVIIRMWIMPNSPQPVKDIKAVLAKFEEKNPNIKVEVTSIDWGSAWTKINTAAISKEAPDITQLGTTWVGVISAMNALEPMNDYVKEIGGGKTFLPATWKTSGILGKDEVTAIPWFVDARALYYRTDVFRKLNINPSDLDTWESFERALKKIKDANLTINNIKVNPFGSPGKNDWNVLHNMAPWIWSAGGDLISADLKSAAFNNPKSIKGVEFYVDLASKGYIPKECLELNTAQVSAKFNEGAYAIYFDTPAQIKNLSLPPEQGGAAGTIAAKNYGVALYHKGPEGRYTFFGGSNLVIFKSSKYKKEAWEVIKYLTSKEAQLAYSEKTGFIPARADCFNDQYFTGDPKRKIFIEAVKYGRVYPCISAWGPIEPIMMRHIGIIWDHVAGVFGEFKKSIVKDELDKAAKEVNILIKESLEK